MRITRENVLLEVQYLDEQYLELVYRILRQFPHSASMDDKVMPNELEQAIVRWRALNAFEAGDLSLGQLANTLNKSKAETLEMLGQLGICVADYDLMEDLDTVEALLKS